MGRPYVFPPPKGITFSTQAGRKVVIPQKSPGVPNSRNLKTINPSEKRRLRDPAILERFYFPGTIQDITDLWGECKEEQRYKKGHRRVTQLVGYGYLFVVGAIKLPGIKSQTAYCSRKIKSDLLPHEIGVSTVIKAVLREYGEMQAARGIDVDQRFRADAEFIISQHWHLEYDTGSERLKQVIGRFDILKDLPKERKILWIAQTDSRKASIMSIEHPLKKRIIFASLPQFVMNPRGVLAGEEGGVK